MNRYTFAVGTFEENCSLLWQPPMHHGDAASAASAHPIPALVIDPGAEGARIIRELEKRGLTPDAILLTHAHFDHIGGIAALQAKWPELPVYVGAADVAVIEHPLNEYPPDYPHAPKPKNLVAWGGAQGTERPTDITLEGWDITVIPTPGHTPGGVCYYFKAAKLLLSGDTLFHFSCGRTDLPGGDQMDLMDSLRTLKAQIPGDVTVVPGHGPETTMAIEKEGNPFLQ